MRYILVSVAITALFLFWNCIDMGRGTLTPLIAELAFPALVINIFLPTSVRTNRLVNTALLVPLTFIMGYVTFTNANLWNVIFYLCTVVMSSVILIIYPASGVFPWLRLGKEEYVSEIIYSLMPDCFGSFWRKALAILLIAAASAYPLIDVAVSFTDRGWRIYELILTVALMAFISFRCFNRIKGCDGSKCNTRVSTPHIVLFYTLCLLTISFIAKIYWQFNYLICYRHFQ